MIHLENKNTTFKQTPLQKTYFALGTRINLTIFGCENPVILDKTYDLIKYYEDILTVNRDESEVNCLYFLFYFSNNFSYY